ncbi:MAG: putative thiol oxidoreductase with 2 cytochrome c heme-binding site [Myxococcales bacterium]|nr:putative thiol oxidoreductase with 2 cytochrome c heme-binding site [Myxococcales bacterium]
MSRLAILALLAACGDNTPQAEAPPDCSGLAPPATGLTLDAAREAHRRSALRQRLRYREAVEPGYVLRMTAQRADQARIDRKLACTLDLYETGRLLFEHAYTFEEGLAAGPSASPFHRVQTDRRGGPETTTCTSCHFRNGPAGAGGVADNALILGDGDRVSSADARNPPSLIGAGVVQAIGDEMTAELAALRDAAIARGTNVDVELVTKGVSYGVLHVAANGHLDTKDVRGIDPDLVVRPFGWKGTAATINEFIAEAAALHFGIQSEDVVIRAAASNDPVMLGDGPPEDRDGDGIPDELTAGQSTELAVYIASLETQIMKPHEQPVDRAQPSGPTEPYLVDEWAHGRAVFDQIGCASCHVPSLRLHSPAVTIRSPVTGGTVSVDLTREAEAPRIAQDETGDYPVFVFSDFKRHDLGDANASKHPQHGIAPRFYLTRRLWGVGDSAPYFYDGQAVTIDHAIERHGGEAAFARDSWTALSRDDQSALRIFLTSLRRAPRLGVP